MHEDAGKEVCASQTRLAQVCEAHLFNNFNLEKGSVIL